jgi:hypothetical protein
MTKQVQCLYTDLHVIQELATLRSKCCLNSFLPLSIQCQEVTCGNDSRHCQCLFWFFRLILILSTYLRLVLSNGPFPSGFPTKTKITYTLKIIKQIEIDLIQIYIRFRLKHYQCEHWTIFTEMYFTVNIALKWFTEFDSKIAILYALRMKIFAD